MTKSDTVSSEIFNRSLTVTSSYVYTHSLSCSQGGAVAAQQLHQEAASPRRLFLLLRQDQGVSRERPAESQTLHVLNTLYNYMYNTGYFSSIHNKLLPLLGTYNLTN